MIQLTEGEIYALNMLIAQIQASRAELNRQLRGQEAVIKLLEDKYNATFNPTTGQLEENKKEKPKKDEPI